MNHRDRYRRAFTSLSLVAVLALSVVAGSIIGVRGSGQWNGIAFGDGEADVLHRLGAPRHRFETPSIVCLGYRDIDVWLRNDQVYSLQIRGNPDGLYREACLRYGVPIRTEGGNTDWVSGTVVARLYLDELMVSRD